MLRRNRLAFLVGVCLFWASFGFSKGTFRVLSYNVENYWDQDPENTREAWKTFRNTLPKSDRDELGQRFVQYTDYSSQLSNWYEPDVQEAKVRNVLKVIHMANKPELIAFQEIESAGNRSQVFEPGSPLRDGLEAMGYTHFVLGPQAENNPTSVTTAFASTIPLNSLASVNVVHEDRYSTSARDIQVVEIRDGDQRMLIFNNHWKSKAGGVKASEPVRIQSAHLLAARIAEERESEPLTRVLVVGDLNASYFEKPLLELNTTGDETRMLGRKTSTLYNLWFELPEENRWENSFDGERQVLSHMLLSDSFYHEQGFQYVDGSFTVLGQKGDEAKVLLAPDGRPFRWQVKKEAYRAQHLGQGYSDHLPLMASFRVSNTGSSSRKVKLSRPSQEGEISEPKRSVMDVVDLCSSKEMKELDDVDFSDAAHWLGKCVRITGDYPLLGEDNRNANFIRLSVRSKSDHLDLALVMTRSYDGRPNVDDSRVSLEEALKAQSYRSRSPGHPRSNKCFTRKVLRGAGGNLRKVVGRLGFYDGAMAVYVPSREEKHIVLEDLPATKRNACPWDK